MWTDLEQQHALPTREFRPVTRVLLALYGGKARIPLPPMPRATLYCNPDDILTPTGAKWVTSASSRCRQRWAEPLLGRVLPRQSF
jgi:hypothetical protein